MSYEILTTSRFDKEFKTLLKKYKSLPEDIAKLKYLLLQNPKTGVSIGKNAFKVRLAINSKHSGKSGGGRIITYMIDKQGEIYLLTIYDKSEKETITDKELKQMIKELTK